MTATLTAEVYQDDIAVSLANVLATANKRASALDVDATESLLTITQRLREGALVWRINYGPRDYINQRGGDLIVDVAANSGEVEQVLWGQ
jgi:hypothetical protein